MLVVRRPDDYCCSLYTYGRSNPSPLTGDRVNDILVRFFKVIFSSDI